MRATATVPRLVWLFAGVVAVATLTAAGQSPKTRVTASAAEAATAQTEAPQTGATVRRDAYGVPHILASTERAASRGLGYCLAEDHLEQLARLFLRAQGRLAEYFGERFVAQDLLIHKFEIPETAERRFRDLPLHVQAIFEGFAEGYNLYLAEHRNAAPEWAEPITPAGVLAHVRAVSLVDFTSDPSIWRTPPASNASGTGPQGSLMWLAGASKSRSGRSLMLANPHLVWSESRALYEFHVRVPGYVDVAGVAPIGVPAVVIGFNERLGWTLTVNEITSSDTYELTLPAECPKPDMYRYDRACVPLQQRTIALKVKTPTGVVTREEVVYRSHQGPIIRREGAKAWAFRSATLDQVDFITQLNAMARAKTLAEFQAAMNLQALPLFNVGYVDREGQLWYLFDGRIPQRPAGIRPGEPLPGDTSRSEWQGVFPIARLPQLLNPAAGYIQNANDPPWLTVLEQPIDPESFTDVTTARGLSLRGQASLQAMHAKPAYALDDLLAMKNDARWPLAYRLKPDLITLAAEDSSPPLAQAVSVLRAWNDSAAVDSKGSVLFWHWWELYQKSAKPTWREAWNRSAPLDTPRGIGDRPAALQALRTALEEMARDGVAPGAAWGDVYRFRRGNIDVPISGGSGQTGNLRVIYSKQDADKKWSAFAGDSYTLGVEFQDVPVAFSVMPYSESSRPASPHYNDQAGLFVSQRYKRLWFSEQDIAAHTARTYVVPEPAAGTAGRISQERAR
jgi:acyl-homoserine-lactone acylase